MGASGWNFIVEFNGDENNLLPTLHSATWELRRFQLPCGDLEFLEEVELFSADAEERYEIADQYGLRPLLHIAETIGFNNFASWYAQRVRSGHVDTLEELRAMQCISSAGTHSPLDIVGLAITAEDFKLCPLTTAQIVEVFGKSKVDTSELAKMDEMYVACKIPDAYRRWQAVYCPLHTDGRVTHAYVEGATGD